MQISRASSGVLETAADAVVVGVFSDAPAGGAAAAVDRATGGLLSRVLENQDFGGKPYELLPLMSPLGVAARQVILLGLGERAKFDAGMAFRSAGAAARSLAGKPRKQVAFFLNDGWSADIDESALCGAIVGCHGQDLYRDETCRHPFEDLLWAGGGQSAIDRARTIAESVLLARQLVNEPPDVIYPDSFAKRAVEIAAHCGLECEVWDENRLMAERCGAILAVGKGSSNPPRLLKLRYRGGMPGQPALAIIGKGVTFDSGGLSLKTPEGMLSMKCDMAGAATMLAAVRAIALLKLPVNVDGWRGWSKT
jgi:leucyl aminopeptidase